ncbi:hypothetical protein VKT23_011124 [Stygiomarasmius scandens]|uniref:Heterokaryon incompatibility domain-containing protein n=1 Tax=Marasmiellus scandens TaxID=2682957 RepID=A0ABR1JEM8_9AGAR
MRLLNTRTFRLREFHTYTPPYAILSHTWEDEEVIFQDMQDLEAAKRKTGWFKIASACVYARKYEFEWIWIDSCCINKQSSAELSEAINSMYQYYLDAEVCYVFLCDVPGNLRDDPRHAESAFKRSRWFTRGWTLQELIASSYAVFLDCQWTEIGTKWSLQDLLSAITSIPVSVFERGELAEFSIAQKMSWAALRETTRPEDQAYCLMGLFGISMPPIYGEGGQKAFMRLQQEIMKISDDRSIFAWIASPGKSEPRGLLAKSPYEFRASGDIGVSDSDFLGNKSSFSFNNNGLHIHLPLLPVNKNETDLFLAPLQCQTERDGLHLSLYLRKMTSSGKYMRCRASELCLTSPSPAFEDPQELVVMENQFPQRIKKPRNKYRVKVRLLPRAQQCVTYIDTYELITGIFQRNLNMDELQLDSAFGHILRLEYKSQTTKLKERVLINIKRGLGLSGITRLDFFAVPVPLGVYGFVDYLATTIHCNGCPDCISTRLKDNGEMVFRLHITGKDVMLEVDYLPHDLEKPLSREVFSPAKLDFTLLKHPWDALCFHHVFPPDHLQAKRSYNEIYISLPSDSSQINVFCVLTYEFRARFNFYKVFVGVGIHESRTWIDITVFPFRSSPKPKEIWDSYCYGGERVEARLRCQNSASCSIREGVLTATFEKRRNLGLGSHFLDFVWIQKDSTPSSTIRRGNWDESEIEDEDQDSESEENQDIGLLAYARRYDRDRLIYWSNGTSGTSADLG